MYTTLCKTPNYIIPYLEKHFINSSNNKYEQIITGSDEFERKLISIVLSNTITAAIEQFKLDITPSKFDTSS